MSYRLVVSEKPSVAMAYAKVLGATRRKDGYLEGNGYLVSWCIGHLVELAPPNIYDEKYVKWSIQKMIWDTKKYLMTSRQLLQLRLSLTICLTIMMTY